MNKKNLILISFAVAVSFLFTSLTMVQSVTYFEDGLDDVQRYESGVFREKGDFHNEVDIVNITMIGIELTLNLQANPIINDNNHSYSVSIIWSSIGTHQNKTEINVGNIDGNPYVDEVEHTIVNSTGYTLSTQPGLITDSTQVKAKRLTWELDVQLFSHASMTSPENVNATAIHSYMNGAINVKYQDSYIVGETGSPGIIWNMATILSILGTVLVSGFAGYTLGQISVYFLTTNIRSKQNNTIFMAIFVLGLAVLVNYWFWLTPWQVLWNVGVFLLTVVFGYLWATRGILRLKFNSPLPENVPIETEEDRGAIIVISKGESEEYNPLALIRKFFKNEELEVKQKHKFLQPFEFFKVKRKYSAILKSEVEASGKTIKMAEAKNPYTKISKKILEELEESFLDYDMYVNAYVNDWPTINQTLLTVIARGANRVTFLNLFTSESYDYNLVVDEMKRIDYSKIGVTIKQTEFLGEVDDIQDILTSKIKAKIPKGVDPKSVGVLLVSEGQIPEWDSLYPLTENETQFRNGIAKKLISKGFRENNIAQGWIEDRSPTIADGFEKLINEGCTTIIYVAASTPIDCVNSLYDIPEGVKKASAEKEVELVALNGWNTSEELMKVYLGLITKAKPLPLEELGKDAEIILQSTNMDKDDDKEED